uniref:Uncharacterized protein n=1 Tax=Cacopsylla melanoneura TaxID=428564 RepID=A0A8D8XAQ9_9HEMI
MKLRRGNSVLLKRDIGSIEILRSFDNHKVQRERDRETHKQEERGVKGEGREKGRGYRLYNYSSPACSASPAGGVARFFHPHPHQSLDFPFSRSFTSSTTPSLFPPSYIPPINCPYLFFSQSIASPPIFHFQFPLTTHHLLLLSKLHSPHLFLSQQDYCSSSAFASKATSSFPFHLLPLSTSTSLPLCSFPAFDRLFPFRPRGAFFLTRVFVAPCCLFPPDHPLFPSGVCLPLIPGSFRPVTHSSFPVLVYSVEFFFPILTFFPPFLPYSTQMPSLGSSLFSLSLQREKSTEKRATGEESPFFKRKRGETRKL